MQRAVFHLDMDAFFSSVEQISNPHLVGKPVIVCGDPYRRSVVSTASYEAREFGLKSGMPIGRARKLCPQGIFITGNPQKYVYTSVRILHLLREFTPLVEPFSVDEAFLEFIGLSPDLYFNTARRIKARIRERFGLTCSIGISYNKYVSKMASGLEKPDGLTVIMEGEFLDRFGQMPVGELWGVGEKTSSKLNRLGIGRIRDLALYSEKSLCGVFGVYGSYLKLAANGVDQSRVIPYYQGLDPKSVGHEYTFPEDTSEERLLLSTLLRLAEQVGRRMRKEGFLCDTITVKIRYNDFKTITRQRKLEVLTEADEVMYQTARTLFGTNWDRRKIRLLGVSASGLVRKSEAYTNPIFSNDRKQDDCIKVVDSIRDKYGDDSIIRCGSIR